MVNFREKNFRQMFTAENPKNKFCTAPKSCESPHHLTDQERKKMKGGKIGEGRGKGIQKKTSPLADTL